MLLLFGPVEQELPEEQAGHELSAANLKWLVELKEKLGLQGLTPEQFEVPLGLRL